VRVSPLPMGTGFAKSGHGRLPVPGPATLRLLHGFPVRMGDGSAEMVTPTGAAIVAALAKPEAVLADLVVERIGYGAGDKEFADRPNLLRIVLGAAAGRVGVDSLLVLETNIDDLNPEIYEYVLERLFASGARDVWLTPAQMKKNRPGTMLSVLADTADRDRLASVLFAETSTLGVRVAAVERLSIEREIVTVDTEYGRVRVKMGRTAKGAPNVAPEYEDCKRLAAEKGAPLKQVFQAAIAAALRQD
jgi:pyridinium-3,5-bisthiocarboxylic acid mononucleotide nickel chelatase